VEVKGWRMGSWERGNAWLEIERELPGCTRPLERHEVALRGRILGMTAGMGLR